jgi:Flp pilus assembly protein TadD
LPGVARGNARRFVPAIFVFIVALGVFSLVLHYPFLNWDDFDVFVRNDALRAPGLVAWAFTTRYMEHYQPLAWLSWAALDRVVGLTAHNAHAFSLTLHASCAVLAYLVVRAGLKATLYIDESRGRPSGRPEWIAATASLFWAVHPLRVEVVAWASAMPYSLALLFALASMLAWLHGRCWTAVMLLAMSLLARPIAFALPLLWLLSPKVGRTQASFGLALAIGAALIESSARFTATLTEFGVGPRLTLAAAAPWRYLWRTIAPFELTPLDPLTLTPRTDMMVISLGLAGTALVSVAAWHWRHEQPVLAASWLAYLLLLVPAMGIVPSGLQATADRYTYFPAVALSVAAAIAMTEFDAATRRRATTEVVALRIARATIEVVGLRTAVAGIVLGVLVAIAWQQTLYWRDSIALWTRAIEIDARNDVALYNLGAALDEAGRPDAALARYEQVLALAPNHVEARRNRDLLRARQYEEEGNRLAAAGSLVAAVAQYRDAVRLDPRRTHSHAALGMALTQLGRIREAGAHLQTAIDQGVNNPAIANALAFGLVQAGDRDGARAVLHAARQRFPNDANIARNLALLEK